MKRFLLVLILTLVSTASFAVWPNAKNIEVRPGSMLGWDNASATWRPVAVNPVTGQLDVSSTVSIGSVTVDPAAPPDKNSTSIVSATASAQSVASLANRKSVAFINQSASVMGWISLDSAVASAAVGIGIPLPPYGFFSTELDSAKIVGVAADGVASITVYQDGY
jgi:hypothetical protein